MIPIAGPWITEREIEYVRRAVTTGWYSHANEAVEAFELAFSDHARRRHALSLPSCTAGIHLLLTALGIGPGDEVIVPDITWIATSAPVTYVGAIPVFADVDPDTWCVRADAVDSLVTARTKAVIAVDLYGGMPNMDALTDLAAAHSLALIEDAAEAVGSTWRGQPAGSFGIAGVFSFHGSKTLTTGEGGMVVTDDDRLIERMSQLRDHGRRPGDTEFFNADVGFKYKMTAMQAALGLAQLERLPELVSRKRQIFQWYRQAFDGADLTLNVEPDGVVNSYWMVTAILNRNAGMTSGALRSHLATKGVATRPFFHPLSSLPAYAGSRSAAAARERNEVSYQLSPYGLNLPSALMLDEADVRYVAATMLDFMAAGGIS